jgi:hypothetical protein
MRTNLHQNIFAFLLVKLSKDDVRFVIHAQLTSTSGEFVGVPLRGDLTFHIYALTPIVHSSVYVQLVGTT